MATVRTPTHKFITADKGDEVPVGPKSDGITNNTDNPGFNGVFEKLDEILKNMNGDGTINGELVDAANIKDGIADTVTIRRNSGTGKLEVVPLGIDTAQLKDDAGTIAKIEDNFLATGRQIYNSISEAAAAAGSTPAAAIEWAETSTTPVRKLRFFYRKVATDRKVKLVCDAKITSGTWQIRLDVAGTLDTKTGTNTTYAGAPEVVAEVDVSAFANDNVFEVRVDLAVIGGTAPTANMLAPIITVTQDP